MTTAKIYQLNTYNKVNLFNRSYSNCDNILRNVTTQYTTIIFSHPTRGIYFLIHVHNYAKIKGLDLGKITSLPNSGNVFNLHASFQSSPKINRMPITRLICIQGKSSRFLSPVSTMSVRNAWEHTLFFRRTDGKKNAYIFRVSLC